MGKSTKRSVAMVAGSVLAVAGGTAAFAYASGWFKGDGTVYAASSKIQDVTAKIDLGKTKDSLLFPGRTVGITGKVTNPNDYPVEITKIEILNLYSSKEKCDKADADLTFGDVPKSTTIGAYEKEKSVPLGSITMGKNAHEDCAGAAFVLTVKLTGGIADTKPAPEGDSATAPGGKPEATAPGGKPEATAPGGKPEAPKVDGVKDGIGG